MKSAIPYYRVSTQAQGISGLGLDAQKQAIEQFVKTHHLQLLPELIEIESGRNNKRPVLGQALRLCREQKAVLLIAKLDRLGRNVAFISTLLESQVEFIAVDNPHAGKLVIHIMAAFAEHERDLISLRTKEALRAAKQRGVVLGRHGRDVLAEQNRQAADRFARKMDPIIGKLERQGFKTLRQITGELNRRNIPPFRKGSKWHVHTVHCMVKRIEKLSRNSLNH